MPIPPSDPSEHRVVPLRKGTKPGAHPEAAAGPSQAVDDLTRYRQESEPDDYRHRMFANAAGLAVVLLLIAAGIWIADTMASMRKNQDCVLSGRRGCTPVEAPPQQRW